MKKLYLAGKIVGSLTVLKEVGKNRFGEYMWECLCVCGSTSIMRGTVLKRHRVKFCAKCRNANNRKASSSHGLSKTRIYSIWCGVKKRCYNPSEEAYKNYGGRGIIMCKRWQIFENFYQDMYPTYMDDLTLDRINNNGNYTPRNCRWATHKQQAKNTRKSVFLTLEGTEKNVIDWAELSDTKPAIILSRIRRGWEIQDAIFGRIKGQTPVIRHNEKYRAGISCNSSIIIPVEPVTT